MTHADKIDKFIEIEVLAPSHRNHPNSRMEIFRWVEDNLAMPILVIPELVKDVVRKMDNNTAIDLFYEAFREHGYFDY